MELAIYAHPWDLRALPGHGGLRRLRELGFSEVALAVSYHAGRWLTPWHPDGLVRFLEDGTVHFRPRGDYGPLRPQVSSEVRDGEPSPLEALCAEAPAAGLRARAWAVLTHNTRLGELHPDCCVENALGDRYAYALCPANPQVQQYVQALLQDVAAHPGLHAIELEAFGWLGHRHNSHHDKSSFAPEQVADWQLSACFCASCRRGMAALPYEGKPVGEPVVTALRDGVAAAVRRHFADGDAMQAPAGRIDAQAMLQELRAAHGEHVVVILGHRFATLAKVLTEQWQLRRTGTRLCVQAHHDALHGRAALPLPALGHFCDEVALTVYAEGAAGVAAALQQLALQQLELPREGTGRPVLRLSFHPRAPQFTRDDDLRALRDHCVAHGVGTIAVYHLGLLPWRTIERVAKVLTG